MNDVVIETNSLSKCYKMYRNPWHRALEWGSLGKVNKHEKYYALKDITFQVKRGQCLGIIGPNGAGKSTLLKILTGTLHPTLGAFSVSGNVLSLLELGTGFNSELTGRQNLFNSAQIMGYPDEYIKDCIKEIEEFAELGEFFDRPIKIYSTGMYVRLAFSMFVSMKPQVLIIDEALSVGDVFFQQKSFAKIKEIILSGTTCIFVSHDVAAIQNLCDKAILLRHGEIEFMGGPEETVSRYLTSLGMKPGERKPSRSVDVPREVGAQMDPRDIVEHDILRNRTVSRHGAGGMKIIALRVMDKVGRDTLQVEMMETLTFYILIQAKKEIIDPSTGIILYDRFFNRIFSTGARHLRYQLPDLLPGEKLEVRLDLTMNVQPGEYTFAVGVSEPSDEGPNAGYNHDRIEKLGPIVVTFDQNEIMPFYGIAQLPMSVHHCHLGHDEGDV